MFTYAIQQQMAATAAARAKPDPTPAIDESEFLGAPEWGRWLCRNEACMHLAETRGSCCPVHQEDE